MTHHIIPGCVCHSPYSGNLSGGWNVCRGIDSLWPEGHIRYASCFHSAREHRSTFPRATCTMYMLIIRNKILLFSHSYQHKKIEYLRVTALAIVLASDVKLKLYYSPCKTKFMPKSIVLVLVKLKC